jgi:hypothetical protein
MVQLMKRLGTWAYMAVNERKEEKMNENGRMKTQVSKGIKIINEPLCLRE